MLPFLEDIAREFPEPLQPIRQLLTALGVLNEQLDVIGIKVQKTQQLLNLLLLLLILSPLVLEFIRERADCFVSQKNSLPQLGDFCLQFGPLPVERQVFR